MTKTHALLKLCFLFMMPMILGLSGMRDPTQPPGIVATTKDITSAGPLQLTAVFIYPNYRLAIINGQMVVPGDHFGELLVTNILNDAVELMGPDDRKVILPLVIPIVTPIKQAR